jgi:hypothetical protein
MPSILQGGAKPAPMAPPSSQGISDIHGGQKPAPVGGEARSTLVSHGDGTHHIEHEDGSQTDHGHIGHALMAMAGKHSEGMHHHTHSDGMGGGHTVHTAAHGGEPEGPQEHENMDSVKSGMDDFFGEDSGSEEPSDGGKDGKSKEKTSENKDWD